MSETSGRIAQVENAILRGLVLSNDRTWVPISEKLAADEIILAHLAAGEVLCNGRWSSIDEALAAARSLSPESMNSADAMNDGSAPETKVMQIETLESTQETSLYKIELPKDKE
jgi:hypothetical protein